MIRKQTPEILSSSPIRSAKWPCSNTAIIFINTLRPIMLSHWRRVIATLVQLYLIWTIKEGCGSFPRQILTTCAQSSSKQCAHQRHDLRKFYKWATDKLQSDSNWPQKLAQPSTHSGQGLDHHATDALHEFMDLILWPDCSDFVMDLHQMCESTVLRSHYSWKNASYSNRHNWYIVIFWKSKQFQIQI